MNDSSSASPRVASTSHSIPAAPVALGAAMWGGPLQDPACQFQVCVVGEEPPRFSARARTAGRPDEAARLEELEEIGMRLLAVSSPSRFNPETWERILRMACYPEHALGPLLRLIRRGASVDPRPDEPLGPPIMSRNHGSLYGHIP